MSNSKSIDDSGSSLNSSRSVSVRSSYCQTECPVSCDGNTNELDVNLAGGIIAMSLDENEDIKSSLSTSKKMVNISNQADRNIIGKEDSLPKERKKWARPPVVGQASTSDRSVVSVCSALITSESEEDIVPIKNRSADIMEEPDVCSDRKENASDKTLEGSSDQSSSMFGDHSDILRIPTPSSVSSVTSRPLEWDSGADVGYYQPYELRHSDRELSSIERMALDQGRKEILVRSDPEGKSSTKKLQVKSTVIKMLGVPNSESTPVSNATNSKFNSKNTFIIADKKNNRTRHHHLFPEVIIKNTGNQSDSSSDCNIKQRMQKCDEVRISPPKKSSSLENVSSNKIGDKQSATFPRSQSQLNLIDEPGIIHSPQFQHILNPPQSVSSSSVATVVTGTPRKMSKSIQASYLKNISMAQSSLFNVGNKKTVRSRSAISESQNTEPVNSSTLESVQMSADDRVNSFEYLPGHVYENAQKSEDSIQWEENRVVSLKDDVERGVQLLEEFIQGSNANDTLKKKELIQRVVKRIIETDYREDEESHNSLPVRCSTRRSQNRDEAIGESSTENIPTSKNKPSGNSTSLSGQSSSLWLSVTESSKSSDPSYPNQILNNANQKRTVDGGKNKAKPKSDSTSDWKAPATIAEQTYEHKRKDAASVKVAGDEKLLKFLNFERKNQIGWIVKEIDHLSNLKSLLEKHEKLRRNLQKLKHERRGKDGRFESGIRPSNHQRFYGFQRKTPSKHDMPKRPLSTSRPQDKIEEEGWDSHNYVTSDNLKLKKTVSTETRKEDIFGKRRSVAYTITFDTDHPIKKKTNDSDGKSLIADRQTLARESKELVREMYPLPTLQDHLLAARPDLVSRAEDRRKTVAELTAVRQLRQEKRPAVLVAALSSGSNIFQPPPPPLVKRVCSQKEMRMQTEKKYKKTFEVKKKISEQKLKETLKTNRIMAEVYNKRLQLLTLKGRTDLSNSVDVISTV